MTRAEKTQAIEQLKEKFGSTDFFYIADASTMTVEEVTKFRRACFEKGVEVKVVKNTLAKKALEATNEDKGYEGIYDALKGPSALLFTDTANVPAKIIKEFRGDKEYPILKAAYIDTSVYTGDDQLEALASIKSKEELIGDVLMLLQSPMKNLVGALCSGRAGITGILKALEERGE
ncbi:MAG: 50S ribosomal protein L10 [Bacteroidota bacterium]